MNKAQREFYTHIHIHGNDRNKLFKVTNSLFAKKKMSLSEHCNSYQLANSFADFVQTKVNTIRSQLDNIPCDGINIDGTGRCALKNTAPRFSRFGELSSDDIKTRG